MVSVILSLGLDMWYQTEKQRLFSDLIFKDFQVILAAYIIPEDDFCFCNTHKYSDKGDHLIRTGTQQPGFFSVSQPQ